MKSTKYLYVLICTVLFFCTAFLNSCGKEYETIPTPFNEITSFKVAYLGGTDSINAVLEGENITIVWPGSIEWPIPVTVKPTITVSKNATVFPASNAEIALVDGTVFTVTAQDGSTRKYNLKVINGAMLPSFVNDNVLNMRVGQYASLVFYNLSGDGSDRLFLVNDANKEFELINRTQFAVSSIGFIADQPDGSGIPAGQYYVKVTNRYNVPVISTTKMVTINEEAKVPYIYFQHTQPIEVKRGGTLTLPIRYFGEGYGINLSRFYYQDPNLEYVSFIALTYIGTNATYDQVSFKVPEDAPVGMTMESEIGLQTRATYGGSNLAASRTGYYPHSIKIVE